MDHNNQAKKFGPIRANAEASQTFIVTPASDAALTRYPISASFDNGTVTAYNDVRVEVVSGVEGRFQRWGNFAEYDQWAAEFTYVSGRSGAERQIGAGESITVPVVVTNRTATAKSGTVTLDVDAPLSVDAGSAGFTDLAPDAATTVEVVVTHTDSTDPGGTVVDVPITTTTDTTTSTEALRLYVVPTTVIPEADVAPTVDGLGDDPGYGAALDIGRRWEGSACDPDGVDCGTGSTARLAWHGDDLYAVAHVVDDRASASAPMERCFGHWLVDSVEFLLDPLSGSRDTSTTFKSGVMPFTDDPSGTAGQGVDGPCWSRDADNHQGFSSGPLADSVEDAPNAPGQEVAVTVNRTPDGDYDGGAYTIEVKLPLANLPAAVVSSAAPTGDPATNTVDPRYLGLNVTPYDSDVATFIGKTRTAWSPFGSQQSEPYRWGHAYLDGYEAPADRPTESVAPRIPDTALKGVESPQTIFQSAVRGVTIAGLPASRALTLGAVVVDGGSVAVEFSSTQGGTLRAYAYRGNPGFTPVWVSSCDGDVFGFSTCAPEDVTTPPWSPDMGGHLAGSGLADVGVGEGSLSFDHAGQLSDGGSVLISFETTDGAVNAWYVPVD